MDGLKHPVGEHTANVYWRRRVSVIAAVVLFGLLVWWIVGALTADSAEPGGGSSPEPTASVSTSPTAAADPGRPCSDVDITVATGPKDAVFTASKTPTFKVTVKSVADTTCVVDPGKDSKIVIASGSDTWFDSSTCEGYSVYDAEKFLIEPGDKHTLTATWNTGRGETGCPGGDPTRHAGFYWITATVQDVSADKLQFEVR